MYIIKKSNKTILQLVYHYFYKPKQLYYPGFIHTEGKKGSIQRIVYPASDVAQCEGLTKVYPALTGPRVALQNLTLGIPSGQVRA